MIDSKSLNSNPVATAPGSVVDWHILSNSAFTIYDSRFTIYFPVSLSFGFSLASQYNFVVLIKDFFNPPDRRPLGLLLKRKGKGVRPWRSL